MSDVQHVGVKETKEAVLAAVAVANAVKAATADGKVGLDDLAQLLVVLPKIAVAVDGADKIPAEVMDLDAAEGQELVASVAADLQVGSEKAKSIVLASLDLLISARKVVVAATA